MIRPVTLADSQAICDIYNHYVLNTRVSFEEAAVSPSEMEARIRKTTAAHPWFVHEGEGGVLGYAYATAWKERSAYRFSVESTVYIKQGHQRQGLGRALYEVLVDETRKRGFHLMIAGIALPNQGSVGLHEALGFSKVGEFTEVGHKLGSWASVGYWQLAL